MSVPKMNKKERQKVNKKHPLEKILPILKSMYPSPPDMTNIDVGFSFPSMHFGGVGGDDLLEGDDELVNPDPELVNPPLPGTETKNLTASRWP